MTLVFLVVACTGPEAEDPPASTADPDWTLLGDRAAIFRHIDVPFDPDVLPRLGAGLGIVDVDLDGLPELGIGAPYTTSDPDHYTPDTENAAYFVGYTPPSSSEVEVSEAAVAILRGAPDRFFFGEVISAQGDVDGDGSHEVHVSGWDLNLPLSGDQSVSSAAGWGWVRPPDFEDHNSTWGVVHCGDFNGDGHDDHCGAIGGVWFGPIVDGAEFRPPDIPFGGEFMHAGNLTEGQFGLVTGVDIANEERGLVRILVPSDPEWVEISGSEPGDRVGNWISIGDLNHDGNGDVFVASILANGAAGRAWVWLESDRSGSLDEASIRFEGRYAGDALGRASIIADFDGDGADDLAIGIAGFPGRQTNRPGRVAVFRGPIAPGTYDEGDADVVWYGSDTADDGFGTTLAAADLDGDGAAELAVGAPEDSQIQRNGGAVYLIDTPLP